jgi:hypothetical protein
VVDVISVVYVTRVPALGFTRQMLYDHDSLLAIGSGNDVLNTSFFMLTISHTHASAILDRGNECESISMKNSMNSDYLDLLMEKRQVASILRNHYLMTAILVTAAIHYYFVIRKAASRKPITTGHLNISIAAPRAGIFITETLCR